MKIDSYSVQAASNWKFYSEDIEIRSVKQKTIRVETPSPAQTTGGGVPAQTVTIELSADAKSLLQKMETVREKAAEDLRAQSGRAAGRADSPENHALEVRRNILEALLYRLTGKKFVFKTISLDPEAFREARSASAGATDLGGLTFSIGGQSAATGVSLSVGGQSSQKQLVMTETDFFAAHYESESLRYEAKGLVKTADGRTISVDIGLNMSREAFMSVRGSSTTAELQSFADPLVINFTGTAASLTEKKFEFDLDADGRLDSISFAGEGSGFLALDKNGDGRIGDGSELFGPQSGSGFGELRAYDSDGNGWIDENEDVFSKLRIFGKDENGGDLLFTLREADVGAIYLGDVSTQYTLGSNGAADGMLRSTSMFLKESGGAGLISHIDLAV
ncbi:MAG: VCBS repeat-containing protein [Clostridiales Family XIII bacterium]|jgi:hypothetical protein|nr:VCBS repeat-containing protein [Clostridiales Family XIII bacterium]